MVSLVLGPLLRYVDDTSASVWVEVSEAATVRVSAGDHSASARTFGVHGHHYALVCLDGLEPGTHMPYTVELDGATVWPEPDSHFPPSVIPTLRPGKPLRMAFGSCRVSVPHDEEGTEAFGVDALRAYALHMATDDSARWPDLVLFLGDQVYADETSQEMQEFIASRRSLDEPPGEELKDYTEYAYLYRIAWSDPANRWLLSTLPSAMIFDDHDIRDDWNTSWTWRQEMAQKPWWHDRIVGGLASYWVYQHLGNLDPAARAEDVIWQRIASWDHEEEIDLTDELDALAEQYEGFRYDITLSQPPAGWTGLQGRLGESVPPLLPTLGGKRFYLVGNGAMLEEMGQALSDMGVVQQQIYKEPYFDPIHDPDRETVAAIRERFVAIDLFSPYAARRGSAFDVDRDIEMARTGKAGNGDPLAVSDIFDLLPAYLSHHPDQEDPQPTHAERPWNRP